MNDMMEKKRFSPGMQLSVLLISFGVCYLLSGIVIFAIAKIYLGQPLDVLIKKPELIEGNAGLSKLLQVVGTVFMFGLPAFIFATVINKQQPLKQLGFNKIISGRQLLYVVAIMICAIWVGEALGLVTKMIPLPNDLRHHYDDLENSYGDFAKSIFDFNSFNGYLASIFIIAVLPAILEEVIFRGCLQKVLFNLSNHVFLSIFLSSIAFSIVHGSYYGFFVRLFLGIILGYLYHYSKNLWLNIIAHFLNNAISVTFIYVLVMRGKNVDQAMKNSDFTSHLPSLAITLGGLALTAVTVELLKLYKKESNKVLAAHPEKDDIEQADNDTINYL